MATDIMNPTNMRFYEMIREVSGLREKIIPVSLYCYSTDKNISLNLVSSYLIGHININDFEEMLIYRLKFENTYDDVTTLIATCIYNYRNHTFNYILKNEDENQYQYILNNAN